MREEDEEYFVKISEPAEFRSKILETSKEAVKLLQMHDSMLTLREEKQRNIEELKGCFEEITKLTYMLKRALARAREGEKREIRLVPKVSGKEREKKAKERETTTQLKKSVRRTAEKTKALDELERELSEIEKKIGRL